MGAGAELGPSCLHGKHFPHRTTFAALVSYFCQVYFVTTMRKGTGTEHYLEFVKSKPKALWRLHHADIPFQGQHNDFFRHEDSFKYSSFLLYQFINC